MIEPFDARRLNSARDSLGLLSHEKQQQTNSVKEVIRKFKMLIPARFGNTTFFFEPSPALRANCQNKGCGVRATIHLSRQNSLMPWDFVEKDENNNPRATFNRLENSPCKECSEKQF